MIRLRLIIAWTIWIALCTIAELPQSVPVSRVEGVQLGSLSRNGFLLENPDGHVVAPMNELMRGQSPVRGRERR
jgi:hypothetical protein